MANEGREKGKKREKKRMREPAGFTMTNDPTRSHLSTLTTIDGEVGVKMILSSRPINPSLYFTPKIKIFGVISQNPHGWGATVLGSNHAISK